MRIPSNSGAVGSPIVMIGASAVAASAGPARSGRLAVGTLHRVGALAQEPPPMKLITPRKVLVGAAAAVAASALPLPAARRIEYRQPDAPAVW